MNVLMLGPGLGVQGGISTVERMTLAALPGKVRAVHVATMDGGSKLRKLLTYLRALARVCTAGRPDVAHLHFASRASSVRKMALARLMLARGCKVVMHAHGGAYREYWASLSPRAQHRNLAVLRRIDALIVMGEGWREFYVSIGVPREKVVVLPNPVALPAALPRRERIGKITFVYLGLIAAHKGTFDLVEALGRLPQSTLAKVRVVIAGNGEDRELQRRIRALSLQEAVEVRAWLGPEERDALLASAEAFVLPSYNEGLPMALLESMAWGLAPVVAPVGGIPEVVEDERTGLLVRSGDLAGLAAAIEKLALDPALCARLGAAARRRVEPLAVDAYARKLGALYEAVTCNKLVICSS
jgi:glycosyltransferase involved in cell wall biosynthesis